MTLVTPKYNQEIPKELFELIPELNDKLTPLIQSEDSSEKEESYADRAIRKLKERVSSRECGSVIVDHAGRLFDPSYDALEGKKVKPIVHAGSSGLSYDKSYDANGRERLKPIVHAGENFEFSGSKTYWYCFISGLDKPQEISLVKELIFWEKIYHCDDSHVEILVPGHYTKKYNFFRQHFQIKDVPCLILTDELDYPTDYITLSKKFISQEYMGNNYEKLQGVLDSLHYILYLEGNFSKVKSDVIIKRIEHITGKVWSQIKPYVSIKIG